MNLLVAAVACTLSFSRPLYIPEGPACDAGLSALREARHIVYALHLKPAWYDVANRPWPGLRDTVVGIWVDPAPDDSTTRYRIVKAVSERCAWSAYVVPGVVEGADTTWGCVSNFVLIIPTAYRPMPDGWPLR